MLTMGSYCRLTLLRPCLVFDRQTGVQDCINRLTDVQDLLGEIPRCCAPLLLLSPTDTLVITVPLYVHVGAVFFTRCHGCVLLL